MCLIQDVRSSTPWGPNNYCQNSLLMSTICTHSEFYQESFDSAPVVVYSLAWSDTPGAVRWPPLLPRSDSWWMKMRNEWITELMKARSHPVKMYSYWGNCRSLPQQKQSLRRGSTEGPFKFYLHIYKLQYRFGDFLIHLQISLHKHGFWIHISRFSYTFTNLITRARIEIRLHSSPPTFANSFATIMAPWFRDFFVFFFFIVRQT